MPAGAIREGGRCHKAGFEPAIPVERIPLGKAHSKNEEQLQKRKLAPVRDGLGEQPPPAHPKLGEGLCASVSGELTKRRSRNV